MKGRMVSLLALIMILLCAIACDNHKPIYEPPGGYIAGMVTDSISNIPIVSAIVSSDTIFDTTTDGLTDTLGHYVMFVGFPGINRLAYCWKEGYLVESKPYSVASNETTLVDFWLVPR